MSINLHCDELELYQTPTYITHMCYSNCDGGYKGILYRYEQWIRSKLDGVWEDEKELNDLRKKNRRPYKQIKKF